MAKIGFAITSSYCTINEMIEQMALLKEIGHEVIPIVSEGIVKNNTRCSIGEEVRKLIEDVTSKKVVSNILEAEKFGPREVLDLLIIAPATGNFIAKLANGITDSTVTMATKATLRNGKPIVIGVSTNDGLGANGENIMKLINRKNIYFVPFGQDDYIKKPNSLILHNSLIIPTIEKALENTQIQPVLKEYTKKKI